MICFRRYVHILLAVLALMVYAGDLQAQPAAPSDTTEKHWYDTLTVTQPKYAQSTDLETIALSLYTAIAIPAALAVGTFTVLSPSAVVLREDDRSHGGIALSTGVGFGGDHSADTWFPLFRVQGEVAWFPIRERTLLGRLSVMRDVHIAPVDRRELFWFGIAGGGGVSTDFHEYSPYVEGFIGLSNPLGVRYLPLFPAHHYGIRVRTGYDIAGESLWYELSLITTSMFPGP